MMRRCWCPPRRKLTARTPFERLSSHLNPSPCSLFSSVLSVIRFFSPYFPPQILCPLQRQHAQSRSRDHPTDHRPLTTVLFIVEPSYASPRLKRQRGGHESPTPRTLNLEPRTYYCFTKSKLVVLPSSLSSTLALAVLPS